MLATKTLSVRTTSAAQETQARISQRPCKRVPAAPGRSGLIAASADVDQICIDIFLSRSSCRTEGCPQERAIDVCDAVRGNKLYHEGNGTFLLMNGENAEKFYALYDLF